MNHKNIINAFDELILNLRQIMLDIDIDESDDSREIERYIRLKRTYITMKCCRDNLLDELDIDKKHSLIDMFGRMIDFDG